MRGWRCACARGCEPRRISILESVNSHVARVPVRVPAHVRRSGSVAGGDGLRRDEERRDGMSMCEVDVASLYVSGVCDPVLISVTIQL